MIKQKRENIETFKKAFTKLFLTVSLLQVVGLFVNMFTGIKFNMSLTILLFIGYIVLALNYRVINKGAIFIVIAIILSCKLKLDMNFFKSYYLRVPINLGLIGMVYYSFDYKVLLDNMKKINFLVVMFFCINMVMYFSKNQIFFKDIYAESTLRFRGFIGDANGLGAISTFILYITLINLKQKKTLIPTVCMLILIFITGSRANSLVGVTMTIIYIFSMKNISKIGSAILIIGLFSRQILSVIMKSSVINRIINVGFGGNGREILAETARYIWENSSIIEKISGVNISDQYVLMSTTINDFPYHDFAENSLITCKMLLGGAGIVLLVIIFGAYIKKMLDKSLANAKEILGMLGIILIFIHQDIILSMQMFIFMILAIESLRTSIEIRDA